MLTNLDLKVSANKWFLPLVWASDICARALAEGKVRPQTVKCLIGELCNIREKLTGGKSGNISYTKKYHILQAS